jgi:hypothetical protein
LKVYRSHFGVDNESIEKISQRLVYLWITWRD